MTSSTRDYTCRYSQLSSSSEVRITGATESDLETCFNALYGYITLSLQHKEVSEETKKSMKQISAFLAMLAHRYKMEQEASRPKTPTHN